VVNAAAGALVLVLGKPIGPRIRTFDPSELFPDLLPTEYQRRWARWEADHADEGGA
jgi:hypothetical protein